MILDKTFDLSNFISLRHLYLRVFDIRKGEAKRVVLMQIIIFLLISTVLVIKPTINSLFLSDVGIEKLPHAFILVAITAGIITSFYSRLLNRLPLNKIIRFTLIFSVLAISSFSVLLKLDLIDKWILYVFYAWVAVFGVLATSQFWILANVIFNAREAKRLFSLLGGAAISGGIFGGYLTSLLAPVIGSENLLFIGVFFLIVCIPLTRILWNSNEELAKSLFKRKQRMGKVSERPYRLILNSKHLTYLALITAIGVLVAKLVDYQFSAISAQKITNEDELTSFFGFWFSNFNIISLLIQLFITRRVVGVYGVGVSLFFLPVGILIGAIAIFITPGLWSAIVIKASDGSLKQSVNKSAIELLALPIPSETKKQAKTFIDVFIDSFSTGLSGIILITFINGLNIPVRFVSILIVLLIIVWIRFVVKVRSEYISLFKSKLNLSDIALKSKGKSLDLSNESVHSGLLKVLENGSDKQILYILKNTDDLQHEKLFEGLKKLLSHHNPEIVTQALRKLYFYKTENLNTLVYGFIESPDDEIRIAAIEYIIEHSEVDRLEIICNYLKSGNQKVSLAAMIAFANETRDNPELRDEIDFTGIVGSKLKDLAEIKDQDEVRYQSIQLLRVISTSGLKEFKKFIFESLQSADEKIQKAAINAAGQSLDPRFISELLDRITIDTQREEAIEALSFYGFRVIDNFRRLVNEGSLKPEIIYSLPLVIEKIGTQYGVDYLFELLEYKDIGVRNQAVMALSRLKSANSHLVFYNKRIIQNIYEEARLFMNTLTALYFQQELITPKEATSKVEDANKSLISLLERRLDDNLQRIFKFLGLKYPPEEINTIYREIKSDKTEMRINAIEFLDNLLETNLKKLLIPLIETSLTETITKEVLKDLKIKIVGHLECFSMLLEGKDLKVKLAVLYLLAVLKDRKYLPLAANYADHPDKKISTFALNAVRAMSGE